MQKRRFAPLVIAGMTLFLATVAWADVPAPPVNQELGFPDVAIGSLTEADCRVCHPTGIPDRHHMLYGQPIPAGSLVPYPDSDGDGEPDDTYVCLSCHDQDFTVVRDCLVCHTSSPHHTTPAALAGDCVNCHGDVVDNMDDGHYIPSYDPSLVTPFRSQGQGLPLNSRDNGAGACNYCHDDDGLSPSVILDNFSLHHGTGLTNCSWCHNFGLPFNEQIRVCEGCHGPDTLHNIQADSPNPDNPGTIVVGGEDAGYGHVGRDAGAGDSDCWGCHGFAMAFAPGSGPVVPTLYGADRAIVDAGADTSVTLSGAAFTNVTGTEEYVSKVALTASDGAAVVLTPDVVDQGSLTVTIPGETAPGNYNLQAVKADGAGDDVASNPAVLVIRPRVIISEAKGGSVVEIAGSGFGGYAAGSGTSVTGTVTTRTGRNEKVRTATATVLSWSDTSIEADFGDGVRPDEVTVNSVYGSETAQVSSRGGLGRRIKK